MHEEIDNNEPQEEVVEIPLEEVATKEEEFNEDTYVVTEQPKISVANQEFIKNNYKKMDLTNLSFATGMPPEDITMYIDAYEMYVKQNGGSSNERVNFITSVDENGFIGFGLQWPDMQRSEKILPHLGKVLFILNEGKIKQQMLQFLIRYSEEKGAYNAVKTIIAGWKEQEIAQGKQPLVQPHEVFNGNG